MMRSATAAEALRGLTRVRPHGWLTDPLPTDPAAAADLLREALAHHDTPEGVSGGPVRVLAARATAVVGTVGDPVHAVLKVHADPAAHNAEALAYALAGHSPALPLLLGADDASRSLLIEHIPHPVDWTCPTAPPGLIGAVVAVHAAPASLPAELAGVFDAFRLDRLTVAPPPAWLPEPAAWPDVLALARDAHGGDAILLGHLDLKPEHARRRDGGPVLVDIETLRPDITGLVDLVTLPAVLRQAGHELPGREVLALYRAAAARHGITWTRPGLLAALVAFARATGLDTLDGLADPPPSRRTHKDTPMEPTAPAAALVGAALTALGLDGPPKHLTGRKGSDVWQAGEQIIKTAVPGARGDLAHETAAYALLRDQGRHPGTLHGSGDLGRWLALPRLDGPSLWEVFAPAREGHATEAQRTVMRDAARASFAALAELHAAGWIHGDMQAENVIITGDGPGFIDYDRSHHPDLEPAAAPYRGGLIHVIAPEIAAQLLATDDDTHVPLTPAAEVYALGASLYWAWTGVRITDYRGDPAGAHTELYADIAASRRRSITTDRPWADSILETLITTATAPIPEDRRPGTAV
ncbi:hypothetical protein ABZY68_25495 [Streptomyces sp. NPDC006482]|uniref:hypothetical protein n=1 Tax=Streptomyces sp. NPDC006482 TaxID=3154306 RepID=UPI0033B6A6CF